MSLVCPRGGEEHGPHDDAAKFCSICGKELEVVKVTRRYRCAGCEWEGPDRLLVGRVFELLPGTVIE